MEIERSADDICMAFLLERRLLEGGEEEPAFDGEVVGLIPSGCFLRFGEEGFEGFLPVRRMDDYWTLNEEGTVMSAERSGRAIRLGDELEVTVGRVDTLRGRVDLYEATGRG
jgi:exoribonuclease R